MSRILTGICEADPARRLYKVAVSRGNTFLSAKERFRVQVCFKNAITHPDEDRLLAELLTVHHFLADTSILWHMEQKLMHAPRHGQPRPHGCQRYISVRPARPMW